MTANGYHILVVDDDPSVLEMTTLALDTEGYRTTPALGGKAALEALERRYYDLVLTDLNMPGADGADVLRKARENLPQAPVIIMTGNPNQVAAHCGVRNRPDSILEKPFSHADLLTKLLACLCPCNS